MNTIFIVISIALIFVNLTTSKPIINGLKSSSDTGVAGVILTEGTKNKEKKRGCLEWIKITITNQMKCRNFKYNGPE